jgi:hypothetical protein
MVKSFGRLSKCAGLIIVVVVNGGKVERVEKWNREIPGLKHYLLSFV